jgi:GNAT superfamily N-acetyltransferase
MLIRLTNLPMPRDVFECRPGQMIETRRAMTYEQGHIIAWIKKTFSPLWADECKAAFGKHPVGCMIAVADDCLVGFCGVDCTLRGFAGPIGVDSSWQRLGIGRALLVMALHAMKAMGYGYCIMGNVSAASFFEKVAGAVSIESVKADIYPRKFVE